MNIAYVSFLVVSVLLFALLGYDLSTQGINSPNTVVGLTFILMAGMAYFKRRVSLAYTLLLLSYAAVLAVNSHLVLGSEAPVSAANLAMYAMFSGLLFVTHEARS